MSEDEITENESLGSHTTFKIGGSADFLVHPSSVQAFKDLILLLRKDDISHFVMGNGSNIIFKDDGYRGVVIKTSKMNSCKVCNDIIEAESGITLGRLALTASNSALSGLEFAAGIPGTLGGAVYINAGAYGGEMKDVVISTTYLDENNLEKITTNHSFGYRTSTFKNTKNIILSSQMKLTSGETETIKAKMRELAGFRTAKQPLNLPSAGSVFKRPEGYYAGKLIDDCGLKGYKIGGAQVSEKHCGFIVNTGGATASDVLLLIEHIQNAVKIQFGVDLETEIVIV